MTKALILAAGEGTRLRPLTADRPKVMLPLGGKPLLEHLLVWLRDQGVCQIAVNLHHHPEAITGYFGDGAAWGVQLVYSREDTLLGTAGAAKRLSPFLDSTFLVVYGDLLTNLRLSPLLDVHRRCRSLATLALYRVGNPWECGLVALDQDGRVERFVEKPPRDQVFSDLANAGVYVCEPDVLAHIPEDQPSDFGRDVFPRLLELGLPVYGYPISDYLLDIGTPAKYAQAQRDLASGRLGPAGTIAVLPRGGAYQVENQT